MDHTTARKRPSAKFHKYLPYLEHQAGYQRFRATSSALHRYIQTEMEFIDIHPWARPTGMSSKSSKSSNKRCDNLGLGTPHNKSQEREAPTHKTKDRAKMDSIRKTSPSCKHRRTPKRQIRIPGSGVASIRALGITLLNATQSSHWWPK
jgi:hypothetical protein